MGSCIRCYKFNQVALKNKSCSTVAKVAKKLPSNLWLRLIAHVRYIKIVTRLRGFRVKMQIFLDSIVSQFPEED